MPVVNRRISVFIDLGIIHRPTVPYHHSSLRFVILPVRPATCPVPVACVYLTVVRYTCCDFTCHLLHLLIIPPFFDTRTVIVLWKADASLPCDMGLPLFLLFIVGLTYAATACHPVRALFFLVPPVAYLLVTYLVFSPSDDGDHHYGSYSAFCSVFCLPGIDILPEISCSGVVGISIDYPFPLPPLTSLPLS